MSNDLALRMYEFQGHLIEIKGELGKIKKENDELKNQIAANNLTKTDDDHAKLSEIVGAIQVNVTTLSTKVSRSDHILSGISETLKKQNETLEKLNKAIEIFKTKEKSMADDQTKLCRNLETIQEKVTTLSANDDETIILLGGNSLKKKTDSLLILQNDGENDESWEELNITLPYAVWGHGAQFLDNALYIFGGENKREEVLSSAYKLTRGHRWLNNNLQWDKIKDMNEKRSHISNSCVILNDRIWVIGGSNGNNPLKCVEMYDPQTNIWTNMKEMNECRELPAAAVVHGKIFCCGGVNGYVLKSAECYHPSSNIWTLISDMPGPNVGCGIVVMDAHLIVIGGAADIGKDFLNSVWVLDTTDENAKWIEKEPRLSRPLFHFSIAKINDRIFLCGGGVFGQKDSKLYAINNVEIFDGEEWRNGPKMPISLYNTVAVVIPMKFARYLK